MGPNQTKTIIDPCTKSRQIGALLSVLSYVGSLALVCVLSIAVGLGPVLAILVFWLGGGVLLCIGAFVYEFLGRVSASWQIDSAIVRPVATA